jgi:hypothetical protein
MRGEDESNRSQVLRVERHAVPDHHGHRIHAHSGFVPTRSPAEGAEEVAQFIIDSRTRIRSGMILSMFSASLLMTYAVSMMIPYRGPSLRAGLHPVRAWRDLRS